MGSKIKKSKTSTEPTEFALILKTLKSLLRQRKISYADLAKKVGLSESGIKKIFTSKDCSYRRLSQIANALGFRVSDLLNEIENTETTKVQFTEKQQQYLLKNMPAFRLFIKLAVERQNLSDLIKEFRLSEKETFSLLKKLDDLKLIELHANNKIKLPPLSLVKDFGNGPLMSALYQEWGAHIVKDLADPKYQHHGNFIVRCLRLKKESYEELLSKILELENEFLRRAVSEMSVSTSELKTVRWMWMTDDQSYIRGSL